MIPAALERLVKAVGERGASYVNACALRLRSTARARYLPFIEQEFPHLAKRYRATYAHDHNVSDDVQRAAARADASALREARRGRTARVRPRRRDVDERRRRSASCEATDCVDGIGSARRSSCRAHP